MAQQRAGGWVSEIPTTCGRNKRKQPQLLGKSEELPTCGRKPAESLKLEPKLWAMYQNGATSKKMTKVPAFLNPFPIFSGLWGSEFSLVWLMLTVTSGEFCRNTHRNISQPSLKALWSKTCHYHWLGGSAPWPYVPAVSHVASNRTNLRWTHGHPQRWSHHVAGNWLSCKCPLKIINSGKIFIHIIYIYIYLYIYIIYIYIYYIYIIYI